MNKLLIKKILFFVVCFFVLNRLDSLLECDSKNATLSVMPSTGFLQINGTINNFRSILDVSSGSTSALQGSGIINFALGILREGECDAQISGKFDPTGADFIYLRGGQTLVASKLTLVPNVIISGLNNALYGALQFSSPLLIQDVLSELKIGLNGKLNKSILLNNGRLILDKRLDLERDVTISGSGFIECNGFALGLEFQNTLYTSTLEILNGYIDLHSRVPLAGILKVGPVNGASRISGDGNALDFTYGGTLWIRAGHGLLLDNVSLIGLGYNRGTILFEDPNSTITFNNCTIQLDDNYTVSMGKFYFKDTSSTINTNYYSLNFVNAGSYTIDRTSVHLEDTFGRIRQINNINPVYSDGINAFWVNNGVISRPTVSVSFDDYVSDFATYTLTGTIKLSKQNQLWFRGFFAGNALTFDGNGYTLDLSRTDSGVIKVGPNKQLTMKNIVLSGFKPTHVTFTDTQSSLIFGDNCKLLLNDNLSVASTLTFRGGSSMIDGNNYTISMTLDHGILIDSGTTVTLDQVKIKGVVPALPYLYYPGGFASFSATQLGNKYTFTASPNAGFIGEIACDWHPGGNYLVTNKQLGSSNGYNLFRYDGSNDSLTLLPSAFPSNTGGTLSHGQPIEWRADGKYLLVSASLGSEIYSFNSLTEQFTLTTRLNHTRLPDANTIGLRAAWSPSGQYVAHSYYSTTAAAVLGFDIYHVANELPFTFDFVLRTTLGQVLPTFGITQLGAKGTSLSSEKLRWNPAGTYLAGFSSSGVQIFRYSADTLTPVASVATSYSAGYGSLTQYQSGLRTDGAWSSDGNYLISSDWRGSSLFSWNASTETLTFVKKINHISQMPLTGGNAILGVVSEWSDSGNYIIQMYEGGWEDNSSAIVGTDIYKVNGLGTANLTFDLVVRSSNVGSYGVSIHPTEQYIAGIIKTSYTDYDPTPRVYKIVGNSLVLTASNFHTMTGLNGQVALFSPDGTKLAILETVQVGNLVGGDPYLHYNILASVYSFNPSTGTVGARGTQATLNYVVVNYTYNYMWSPDSKYILFATDGHSIFGMYQVDANNNVTTVSPSIYNPSGGTSSHGSGITYNSNNQRVAFSGDGTMYLARLTGVGGSFEPGIKSISWHPNDQHIALSNGASINGIYKLAGNNLSSVLTFTPSSLNSITGLRFSPDGTKIAVTQKSPASVQVFNFDSMSQILTTSSNLLNINAAVSSAIPYEYGVRWSPNGQFIFVTSSEDKAFSILELNASMMLNVKNQYSAGASVDVSRGSGLSYNSVSQRAVFALNNRAGATESTYLRLVSMTGVQVQPPVLISDPPGSLGLTDSTARLVLSNSDILLKENARLGNGIICIVGDTSISGTGYAFSHKIQSVTDSLIQKNSRLTIGDGVMLELLQSDSTKSILQGASSELYLRNAKLLGDSSGLVLNQGHVFIDGISTFSTVSNNSGSAIKILPSCDVKILPGAKLKTSGSVIVV